MGSPRTHLVRTSLAAVSLAALAACAPPPAPTQIAVTTTLTICGGAVPPPGVPPCRTAPTSAAVEVRLGRSVVASGVSDAAGQLLLAVPAGTYVVARTDAEPYLICDAPAVVVAPAATATVVQDCVLNAP